jgi:hypothetical protein
VQSQSYTHDLLGVTVIPRSDGEARSTPSRWFELNSIPRFEINLTERPPP